MSLARRIYCIQAASGKGPQFSARSLLLAKVLSPAKVRCDSPPLGYTFVVRRLFLPPEGRAWWPEPLILVLLAVPMVIRQNALPASAMLIASVVVALYNRFGWPSES
jgi:hypothetical protein